MDFAGMCHHLITKIGAYLRITGILGSVRQCKVSPCLCLMVLFLVDLPYPACEKLKLEVVFCPQDVRSSQMYLEMQWWFKFIHRYPYLGKGCPFDFYFAKMLRIPWNVHLGFKLASVDFCSFLLETHFVMAIVVVVVVVVVVVAIGSNCR